MSSNRAEAIVRPGNVDALAVEISIVLPCLDEAPSIRSCVNAAWHGLGFLGVRGEVIVSDSGSCDGSQRLAEAAGARVEIAPRRGYGAALRHGIDAARGKYTIIADSDGSYDLTNLRGFWLQLECGTDLVIGNRFDGTIARGAMPLLNRYVGNPMLSGIGRILTHANVGDFHSGMRGFRTDAIKALGLRANGMEYASEMIGRAAAANLAIVEIPIDLSRRSGWGSTSHLRPVRDGFRHLNALVACRR